jgi:DNA helicase HerA-like ATPase
MSNGGWHHEHITHIAWVQDGTVTEKTSTRAEMVAFVESGGKAYVKDAKGNKAYLRVRTSSAGNKYVQTYADGIPTDNLLALPRF